MKTLNLLDLFFAILPILIFLIHVKFGPKLKIFGYDDGVTGGIILLAFLYVTGLLTLLVFKPLGYMILVFSFSIRPAFFFICQERALRYQEKHTKLNGAHSCTQPPLISS